MTRKQFLNICSLFGVGIAFDKRLLGQDNTLAAPTPRSQKVTVVGAGAGGLSAAYFAKQRGYQVQLLEASSHIGGRMKINTQFADFPIPLGAEWIETQKDIFKALLNNPSPPIHIRTIPDPPDKKFLNYSWYQFFQDHILPSIAEHIRYQTVVEAIDYSRQPLRLHTNRGILETDKVILSVPLKVLQQQRIRFEPPLPKPQRKAIQEAEIWDGFKAFFEFSTNFYGDKEHEFEVRPKRSGQKIYYNAALGQPTAKHILGLFVVGAPAADYLKRSGEELKEYLLDELDRHFAGQARAHYLQHISQDWNREPYIGGGYLSDHADWRAVKTIGAPVGNTLYFAGGEFTDGEDWVSVHAAAQSAKRVAALL